MHWLIIGVLHLLLWLTKLVGLKDVLFALKHLQKSQTASLEAMPTARHFLRSSMLFLLKKERGEKKAKKEEKLQKGTRLLQF